jgi:nicotinamidase/pyrazinamidase
MKPAVIIVDMLEDNYPKERNPENEEVKIIVPVREFLKKCRLVSIPVIFACDSYIEGDFLFKGRMKPHAMRGTPGANVLADLEPQSTDIILPKRRFSGFFKTDLDQTLRTMGVDTVAVGGVNTHVCVLATALDAVAHDFYTIILEDMSAAHKRQIHENCLEGYRKMLIYPLLKVAKSGEFLEAFAHDQA